MENLYSVKINKTGRYVTYCDDCWYEASDSPMGRFTKDRAEEIAKQMRRHYVYDVTVSNGTDTEVFGLKRQKPAEPVKKNEGKKNFKVSLKRR